MYSLINYLEPDETIIWIGGPNPVYYRQQLVRQCRNCLTATIFILVIVILLQAMSAHQEHTSISKKIWAFVPIAGFIIAGALLLCYYFEKVISPPSWHYAITNRRILSDYLPEGTDPIWKIELSNIKKVTLKELGAGYGTVSVEPAKWIPNGFVDLECIENAKQVCQLIEDTKRILELDAPYKAPYMG